MKNHELDPATRPTRRCRRRTGLLVSAVVTASATLVGCTTSGDEDTLTMVTYGGEAVAPMAAAYAAPVEKELGVKIVQDDPTDYGKLQAMQDADNVTWNVVNAEPFMTAAHCGTMFEKLEGVDTSQEDPRFVTDDCSVPADAYSIVLMYDKTKFGDHPPTGWADFFDTKRFPGKRAVWSYVGGNALEVALLGDGVAPDHLYPLDTDRAYQKLAELKPDLLFYNSLAQSAELLLNGQASMVATLNTRAHVAADAAPDRVGVSWDDALVSWEAWTVPTGASDKDASMAVLDKVADPTAQVKLAATYPVGPTTVGADLSGVPQDLRAWLPTTPEHLEQAVIVDMGYYADNFDDLNTSFTEFQSD